MSGGIIVPDKETAKALNDLARHKTLVKLYEDILFDLQVCEIEGWDKSEYLRMIKAAIDSVFEKIKI